MRRTYLLFLAIALIILMSLLLYTKLPDARPATPDPAKPPSTVKQPVPITDDDEEDNNPVDDDDDERPAKPVSKPKPKPTPTAEKKPRKPKKTAAPQRPKPPPTTDATAVAHKGTLTPDNTAVVVLTHNRPHYLRQCLDGLLHKLGKRRLPVFVSQDGVDAATTQAIRSFDVVTHLHNVQQKARDPGPGENVNYYYIAEHYRFALTELFDVRNFDYVIIVEDDLEVAPDLFDYMDAMAPLLDRTDDVMCISAWNDNGQANAVSDPTAFYRTDIFPGLGWMLNKALWNELSPKWARAYWDDWLREPAQRKDRVCIRPEISRTFTFGQKGVSSGQFFDQYLKHIKLNDQMVDYANVDVDALQKPAYDKWLDSTMDAAQRLDSVDMVRNLDQGTTGGDVRIAYQSARYNAVATVFGITSDEKTGIPRTGYSTRKYQKVVIVRHKGYRVFLHASS